MTTPFAFPQDIFIDILLRLTFKSVLQCKLVSKQWRNLINDPKFLRLYPFNNSTTVFMTITCRTLCCVLNKQPTSIGDPLRPPFTVCRTPITFETCFGYSQKHHQLFLGSSNGAACVKSDNGHFLVYNLFTGSSSYTVEGPPSLRQCSTLWLSCGFGYDRYAYDYKILVAEGISIDVMNVAQNEEMSRFWVYSLKNRGWNSFEGFPYDACDWLHGQIEIRARDNACCFNGVLHWIRKDVIVTYDLHTCRFGEILVPPVVPYEIGYTNLSEVDGQLCYACYVFDDEPDGCLIKVDMWAMKEYGVENSWEKFVRIDYAKADCRTRAWMRYTFFSDWITPTLLYERGDGRKVVLFLHHFYPALFWYDIDEDGGRILGRRSG